MRRNREKRIIKSDAPSVQATKRKRAVCLRSNAVGFDKNGNVRCAERIVRNRMLDMKREPVMSKGSSSENAAVKSPKRRTLKEKLGITQFCDLDEVIQRECIENGIPEALIEENMDVMLMAAQFIMSGKSLKYKVKRSDRDKNSPDIAQTAQWQVKIPTKSIKKLFKKKNLLGAGAFGQVWFAKDKNTKNVVAIKILENDTPKQQRYNLTEIGFLQMLQHKNLLELKESYQVGRHLWIITEYISGGPLSKASREFELRHISFIARELLCGLSYLHNLNIAHRDIKPSNIMLGPDNTVKLVDFGLVCDFHDGPKRKMCGSPFWVPPEMTKNEPYTTKIDIWSFGVVILDLFLENTPYKNSPLQSVFMAAVQGFSEFIDDDKIPSKAQRFLYDCLQINPDKRLSADQLLKRSFVSGKNLEVGFDEVVALTFFTQNLAILGF